MHASRTRIRLCGRLEVEIDGRQVQDGLRGRRGRALLAFLVLNRARPARREELVGALWPEGRAPAGATASPRCSRACARRSDPSA
jgi:DNA-binding SARP family transcriptional activator